MTTHEDIEEEEYTIINQASRSNRTQDK